MSSRGRGYSILISSFLGVVFSLFLPTMGEEGEFWGFLHFAGTGYLNTAIGMAGLAIPAFVLFGFLSSALMSRRGGAARAESENTWRTILLLIFFILPALHWLASSASFLQASRYSGKAASTLAGSFHVLMMATSIMVALSTVYGHRWRTTLLNSYVAAGLTAASLYVFGMPVGTMQLTPFLSTTFLGLERTFGALNDSIWYWANLSTVLVFYGLLVTCARFSRRTALRDATPKNGLSGDGIPKGGLLPTKALLREGNLLFVGSLCLLAYFFSSQFDVRPTTPITHSLLLVVTVISVTMAVLTRQHPETVRKGFVRLAVPLLGMELVLLVVLHFTAERDQMTLMAVLVGFIAVGVVGELAVFGRTTRDSAEA